MQQPPNNQPWQQPQQPNTFYPPQQPQYPPPPNTYYPPQPWQQPPMMPPFQAPPPVPPKRKSKVGLIVGIIAAIVVFGCIGIFALIGTAAKTTTTGTISSSASTTASATSTTATTTNQIAKVGQTITVDSVAATLVSVKTLAADEFTKPKPGNQFIVVHVKLVNHGDSEKDYNPFDFHAKSGSGNITDEEFVPPSSYTANNQLNSGKLSAGGTVEGDIVFQVPKGDHKAELTWQPSFFGNAGDNGWNLGL